MRWLEDSRPHAWGQRRRQALGMTMVIYEKRKLEQVNEAFKEVEDGRVRACPVFGIN
jgi:Zn-dependent alcohol dehydrogenase